MPFQCSSAQGNHNRGPLIDFECDADFCIIAAQVLLKSLDLSVGEALKVSGEGRRAV